MDLGSFPKTNCDQIYAEDWNQVYEMISSTVKNAIIANKPNTCYDNIVQDHFSDCNGCYNTVDYCNCNEYSYYDSANCWYTNCRDYGDLTCHCVFADICSGCGATYCCIGNSPSCVGSYLFTGAVTTIVNACIIEEGCHCDGYDVCLNCYEYLMSCVSLKVCTVQTNSDTTCKQTKSCVNFSNLICENLNISTISNGVCTSTCVFCVEYCCACTGCYNVYCDGTCCGQTDKFNYDFYTCSSLLCNGTNNRAANAYSCVEVTNFSRMCIKEKSKIMTCPQKFDTCPKSILLTTNNSCGGDSYIRYDVIDACNNCYLRCNLLPDEVNTLTQCTDCIKLRVWQKSDGGKGINRISSFGYHII